MKKFVIWSCIVIALAIGTTSLAFSKEKEADQKQIEPAAASAMASAASEARVAASMGVLNAHDDIDSCGSDVNCIAHVLVRTIRNNGNGGGGNSVVYFYHDDQCDDDLIRPVRLGISVAACEALGRRISTRVWGIRYQGESCIDISDKDFEDACIQYAAEL